MFEIFGITLTLTGISIFGLIFSFIVFVGCLIFASVSEEKKSKIYLWVVAFTAFIIFAICLTRLVYVFYNLIIERSLL